MSEEENEIWWIDCDPGTDDALALALMIAHRKVAGITVSLGNGTVEICCKNTAKILGAMGTKVPIYRGSSKAIASHEFDRTDGYFGEDSLGDSELYKDYEGYTDCIKDENGHFALINASKEAIVKKKKFKILALAPLTTLAVAVGLDKNLVDRVDEIYIMGGAINGVGFMNLSTEFNFDRDPDAAYRVLRDFKNIKIVPIESGVNGVFTSEETVSIRNAGTEFSKFFKEISFKMLIDHDENEALIGPLYDAVCAAVAIDNSLIEQFIEVNATIDIDGKFTRGSLVIEWLDINKDHDKLLIEGMTMKKHTHIVKDINHEKYFSIVRNAFKYFR